MSGRLLVLCLIYSALDLSTLAKALPENDPASNFLEKGLDKWEAPAEFRGNYTYFWSGIDDEGRPLWISELGKWNARKVVEGGKESVEKFDKYIDQLVFNIIQSLDLNSTDSASPPQIVAIIDAEGFDYYQFTSPPTVRYIMKKFAYLAPVISKYAHHGYVVNTNYVAEAMASLLRPVLGPAMEKVEFLGTNKSKWTQRILQTLPRDQLPEWYGGAKNFAPLKIFG